MTNIYTSLIQPQFDYCDVVWTNISKGLSDKIQKLQNRGGRIITRSDYSVRSSEILGRLNWERLSIRRSKHDVIMIFKVLNKLTPTHLFEWFTQTKDVHSYRLRSHDVNLSLLQPKSEYMKKSFMFRDAKLRNSLPKEVKMSPNLKTFKKNLESVVFTFDN